MNTKKLAEMIKQSINEGRRLDIRRSPKMNLGDPEHRQALTSAGGQQNAHGGRRYKVSMEEQSDGSKKLKLTKKGNNIDTEPTQDEFRGNI